MQIPKFLEKLLAEDEDELPKGAAQSPIHDPRQIPDTEPGAAKNKKGKKRGRRGGGISGKTLVIGGIVAFVLLVSVLTFPDRSSGDSRPHTQASIGDVVAIDGIEFSIAGTSASTALVGDTRNSVAPAAGNTYYTVTFNVKNIGAGTASLMQTSNFGAKSPRYGFVLIYNGAYTYYSVVQNNNGALLSNYKGNIIPLQTITGNVCFEVPNEVTTSHAPLAIQIYTSNQACTWTLRDAIVEEQSP